MDKKLVVSANPHLRNTDSIAKVMHTVNIALLPAIFMSAYYFGFRAILVILVSVLSAVVTEALIQKFRKKPITVSDGSAILTGILLAFNVPPQIPLWIVALGSFFAIGIVKQAFGGVGFNILNPALAGRAFLLASWPVQMTTTWSSAGGRFASKASEKAMEIGGAFDALTQATPLNVMKSVNKIISESPEGSAKAAQAVEIMSGLKDSYLDLLTGNVAGCIGETSAIALLIGASILFYKGYITWRIPTAYILTVIILALIIPGQDPILHLLSGGLILGAFFMATDMVTSPVTPSGMIYFGIGCGIFTVLIRVWGGYPEGVSYSILLMNVVSPLIDRYTTPKKFGFIKKSK
ncbi:MAG: Na+-transporting NADH:ubiquinone oxidoreductase subunit D [Candidatus Cloacimonadota bacterium]|nr:MAG: Na+-transporting NADH:ubiquinone oxidoreductase subunit D [Candidatus Cloacimonadota bacterium]PIE80647.1 MAG: Na+-transporting NADH:ubiquinone oxidoreductase subunit D [Candidatus Delongbacteria bacterium]